MVRVDCLFEEILLVHSLRTIAHLHMDTLHTCYTVRLHDDVTPVYIKTRVLIPVCLRSLVSRWRGRTVPLPRDCTRPCPASGHVLMVVLMVVALLLLLLLLSQQQSQKDSLYCQCSRPPSENHCTADC